VVIRLTAAVIAASLLGAGCGGGSSRRHAVANYIDGVNAIELKLARPLLEVSRANRAFARPHANAQSVLGRLRTADRRIGVLSRRLAALPAPAEAQRLRRLLLELLGRERSMIGEVEQMAVFVPAFGRTLQPLAPANSVLKRELAGKGSPAKKASALDAFHSSVSSVLSRLRTLSPPPSSRAAWSQEVRTLERTNAAVAALSGALRAKNAKAIPKLVHDFDVAAASNQTLDAQRAVIAGVRAYDLRIKSLNRLGNRISSEEARLQRNVH
jgi:hypothetical protein